MAFQRDILAAGNSAESSKAFVGHVLDDLTALGTTQDTALEILRPICVFTTVAANSGARLPWTPNKGDQIVISNKGANDLTIYPPVDGTIDGAAVNVPYTLPVGMSAIFWCTDALTWIILAQLPIPAPPSPYVLTVEDEGVPVGGPINNINFVGAGVTATAVGPQATVTIPGGAGGCPPDLLPVVLEFPDNTVVQYDVTAPGTAFARTLDAATLGSGTVTYAPGLTAQGRVIYNAQDDKMYFLATKTDSVGPVVTYVLVQFDPRTLAITGEMELPAGWTIGGGANSILVDVTDTWAWISSAFDATFRAFDVVSFTEMFNDGGALQTLSALTSSGLSANAGQILLPDATSGTTFHLITVTGSATFTDAPITVPIIGGNPPDFSTNGFLRRKWIADRNKVILPYIGGGCVMLDLNDLSVLIMTLPASDTIEGSGPFWDPYAERLVNNINGADFGLWIGDDTGATIGIASQNNGDWSGLNQTLGGLALAQSNLIFALAGFAEDVPAFTPAEVYETTDSYTSPGGKTFTPGNECIAPRRRGCEVIEAPQRGGGEWVSPVFRGYVPFGEAFTPQTIGDTPAAIQFLSEIDTAGWFDAPVGSVGTYFTPKIRGDYAVAFGVTAQATTASAVAFPTDYFTYVDRTGVQGTGFPVNAYNQTSFNQGSGSDIVHCNGSTDTIAIFALAQSLWTWDIGADLGNANGSTWLNIWLLKKD